VTPEPPLVFTPAAIVAAVRTSLAFQPIPEGHRFAAYTIIDGTGLRTAVAMKVGDAWTISGLVRHDWDSADRVPEIVLQATWR